MKKSYSVLDTTQYIDVYEREKPENAWIISSEKVTIAAKLDLVIPFTVSSLKLDQVARIQYYWLENVEDESTEVITQKRTYVPAVKCNDFYSKFTDEDSSDHDWNMYDELSNGWICPEISELELYGDPFFMSTRRGRSLIMIVNSCSVAKQIDQEMIDRGLTDVTYASDDCVDDATILENINHIEAFGKIMTQDDADPWQLNQGRNREVPIFTNRGVSGLTLP